MAPELVVMLLLASWAAQALITIWLVDSRDARAVMSLLGFVAVLIAAVVVVTI